MKNEIHKSSENLKKQYKKLSILQLKAQVKKAKLKSKIIFVAVCPLSRRESKSICKGVFES